jgi:glycosyltransferase involved in cell wall biosynthesis
MIVGPADPVALSKAIQHLKDSPEEARRLADAAHKEVADHFSLSLYTQNVVRTLRRARTAAS